MNGVRVPSVKVTVKQWSEKCQALEVAKPKASASWDFLIFSLGGKSRPELAGKRGPLVGWGICWG